MAGLVVRPIQEVGSEGEPGDPQLSATPPVPLAPSGHLDVAAEGDFVLSYHFHPDPGGFARPHVHVRAQPSWAGKSLHKVHLPTGRVPLEAFIRLIIEELDAEPIRKDWDDRLRMLEERFEQRKTW